MKRAVMVAAIAVAAISGCAKRPAEPTALPVEVPAANQIADAKSPGQSEVRGYGSSATENSDLPDEDHNPDESEWKRLRVKWNQPTLKEEPGREVSQLSALGKWVLVKEPPSVYLEISGTLLLVSEDGKTTKPVEWPIPICVLLAKSPQDRPDWTVSHYGDETYTGEGLTGKDLVFGGHLKNRTAGTFAVPFSFLRIHRTIGQTQAFQVGLCLGVKTGKRLTWTTDAPVITDSVTTLKIEGPEPLSPTLQLINACPSPIGENYNPLELIRASNHLRKLGKEKAIAALREYLSIANDPGYFGAHYYDPANIDTSNQWCLATLIPLVFEKDAPTNPDPPPSIREESITVWRGIPFHNHPVPSTSGHPPKTSPFVDWAAEYGKIIDQPLRPSDQPLEAADQVFEMLVRDQPDDDWCALANLRYHLREQACRMVAKFTALRSVNGWPKFPIELNDRGDVSWLKLKAKVAERHLRWDEQLQEYVSGAR